MEYSNLLLMALHASLRAGEAILKINPAQAGIEWKEDHSPVTLADRASQKIILEILSQNQSPALPLLSEEGSPVSFDERKRWESFWLVDPLDGTREYIRQSAEYSVNVALVQNGRPVLGVIVAPALQTAYFAAEGMGSFKATAPFPIPADFQKLMEGAQRLQVKPSGAVGEKLKVVASRSYLSAETRDYIAQLEKKGPVETLSAGSSLKFCRVAEGAADLYPRFSPTMEWDTAAGQAVLESAGGAVLEVPSGLPLVYNKEKLTNPWFIAGAHPIPDAFLLQAH